MYQSSDRGEGNDQVKYTQCVLRALLRVPWAAREGVDVGRLFPAKGPRAEETHSHSENTSLRHDDHNNLCRQFRNSRFGPEFGCAIPNFAIATRMPGANTNAQISANNNVRIGTYMMDWHSSPSRAGRKPKRFQKKLGDCKKSNCA